MNGERSSDAYLSLKALAVYSGMSVRTLRGHLVDAGRPVPFFRIGGKILVRRSDFDTWALQFRVAQDSRFDSIVDDVLKGIR